MPPHRMHLTTLEVTHSRTPREVARLVDRTRPVLPALTSFTHAHRARLVRPMVSYDLAAVAVSFLPACGEPVASPPPADWAGGDGHGGGDGDGEQQQQQQQQKQHGHHRADDAYTYHHLRRDVFDLARTTGVDIDSRYVVPSAHITLGRYLTQEDHATPELRQRWVDAIDEINAWLARDVWDRTDGDFVGEWIVGQEKGLDARSGTLWYGGGKTIMMGEGF